MNQTESHPRSAVCCDRPPGRVRAWNDSFDPVYPRMTALELGRTALRRRLIFVGGVPREETEQE
jgi:hypothetical protein